MPRWGQKAPKSDFDKLAEAITPEQLAEAIGARHRCGKSYECPMPVHEDQAKNPTLVMSRDEGRTVGKCHGAKCRLKGSPVQIGADVWGVREPDAFRRLAAHIGLRNGKRRDTRWRRRASPRDTTVTFPGRLLADKEVDDTGRMVYAAIAAHVADKGPRVALTLKSIAAMAGCSERSARRRVRLLIKPGGYVRRTLRRKRAFFTLPAVRPAPCPPDEPEVQEPQGETSENWPERPDVSQPDENTGRNRTRNVPASDAVIQYETTGSNSKPARKAGSHPHSQHDETEPAREAEGYTVGGEGESITGTNRESEGDAGTEKGVERGDGDGEHVHADTNGRRPGTPALLGWCPNCSGRMPAGRERCETCEHLAARKEAAP